MRRPQARLEGAPLGLAERLGLGAVLLLGAADFLWQLNSSSLYVDEVQSIAVATRPLSHFLHALAQLEVTPPGYFLLLHEWVLRLGSPDHEWIYRLPSALTGVGVVGAVMWLARLVLIRPVAVLLAGGLCALSPFVLEYAQRAQGYVFLALSATVAVAAALQSERSAHHRSRWLTLSLTAVLLSLTFHYVGLLVVVPLCLWLVRHPSLSAGWRTAFVTLPALVVIALVPLVIAQHHYFPQRPGALDSAALTPATAQAMLALPFDGRVDPLRVLGEVVITAALLVTAVRWPAHPPGWRLVAGLAVAAPLVLVIASALGGNAFWGHVMLTRYAAAAAPFVIVLIAAAVLALPRVAGVGLAAGALCAALTGTLASHRRSGFFLDARRVVAYIDAGRRRGDAVLAPVAPAAAVPLLHYGLGASQPAWEGTQAASMVLRARPPRIWLIWPLVGDTRQASAAAVTALHRGGYSLLGLQVFPATLPLAVILVRPSTTTAALAARTRRPQARS